jgi:hypothetical protein
MTTLLVPVPPAKQHIFLLSSSLSRRAYDDHWQLAIGVVHACAAGLFSVFGEPARPAASRAGYDSGYERAAGRLAKRPALAEPRSYTPTHTALDLRRPLSVAAPPSGRPRRRSDQITEPSIQPSI